VPALNRVETPPMIRRYAIALLALACAALPARADGFGFKVCLSGSVSWDCWGCGCGPCGGGCGPCGPGGGQLGPWYQYWPMCAHFNAPAPMTFPFWPSPQLPMPAAPALQPACYSPNVPPYWYGH